MMVKPTLVEGKENALLKSEKAQQHPKGSVGGEQ